MYVFLHEMQIIGKAFVLYCLMLSYMALYGLILPILPYTALYVLTTLSPNSDKPEPKFCHFALEIVDKCLTFWLDMACFHDVSYSFT